MTGAASDIRERILSRLSEEPGHFVSGESLSREMAMTRAAVWKHMQALQRAGWPLECVTRKGYRIPVGRALPYSAAGIRIALRMEESGRNGRNPGGSRNLGGSRLDRQEIDWRITVVDQTDSTSSRLKEMAQAGAPEGVALFAEEQCGGRGRMGRSWSSRHGAGIWMSVLLRPEMAPDQVQSITLAVSVAVVEALREFISETLSSPNPHRAEILAGSIGIKWPNDVLWNGKKICGILTELAAEPDRLSHVVVGIGVNVTHMEEDFPPELRTTAASLRLMLSAEPSQDRNSQAEPLPDRNSQAEPLPDRNRVAALLLKHLSAVILEHRHEGMPGILQRWRDASVTLGRGIRVLDPVNPWDAIAVDIGGDGRLLVERPDGSRTFLLSGEISINTYAG